MPSWDDEAPLEAAAPVAPGAAPQPQRMKHEMNDSEAAAERLKRVREWLESDLGQAAGITCRTSDVGRRSRQAPEG